MSIDPIRKYEIDNQVYTLQSSVTEINVGTDKQFIAAVTGKRIRIMGWEAVSLAAAASVFSMKNGSAGSFLTPRRYAPSNTSGLSNSLEMTDSGYFETSTGVGLFGDVSGQDLSIMLFYLAYTP